MGGQNPNKKEWLRLGHKGLILKGEANTMQNDIALFTKFVIWDLKGLSKNMENKANLIQSIKTGYESIKIEYYLFQSI